MCAATGDPYNGHSREEYERILKAKLRPEVIRSTLAFAGLYQIAHEMIKRSVLEQVREFFWCGIDEEGVKYDEAAYRMSVLDRRTSTVRPMTKFEASTSWLVELEAITEEQALRLSAIYSHRHELTHELVGFIIDVDRTPDIDLLTDACEILKAIGRFWAQQEIDIGSFEHLGDGLDVDDVIPLSFVVLQQCIDAYVAGVTETESSD